jgi:hypothetical protein
LPCEVRFPQTLYHALFGKQPDFWFFLAVVAEKGIVSTCQDGAAYPLKCGFVYVTNYPALAAEQPVKVWAFFVKTRMTNRGSLLAVIQC